MIMINKISGVSHHLLFEACIIGGEYKRDKLQKIFKIIIYDFLFGLFSFGQQTNSCLNCCSYIYSY